MKTFLIVVAGVVVGILVLIAIGLAWVKHKVGNVCEAIAELVLSSGITPFRIHLEKTAEPEWKDAEGITQATRHFEAVGYAAVGDYTVQEMGNVRLRAFWHAETGSYGVLYEYDEVGIVADLVRNFADGTHVTVSCAPESGLDRPLYAPLFRFDLDVREPTTARTLHERLVHESTGREAVSVRAEDFEQVLTEAYTQEMDWRIARGGVSRAEMERVAAINGQGPPDESQIEMIQAMWTGAIGDFIEEEVTRTWLAESGLSALDWERLRDRVLVVHDHGESSDRIDELAWRMVEEAVDMSDDEAVERAHEEAVARLRPVFEGRSIRDGWGSAQSMLPEKRRYERLGQVEDPWPADVYAMTEDDGL